MSFLQKIEKTLDARLRGIFGASSGGAHAPEAIELYRDALDQIAARATVGKRGRIFPFDRIRVELRANTAERRALLEAIFEPAQLLEDAKAALVESRAEAPAGLAIAVEYPESAVVDLRVLCEKASVAAPAEAAQPAPLKPMRLVTLTGASSSVEYYPDRPHVNIGRVGEVVDSLGRAVRRNDLSFPEGADEANASVSRSHAHLQFDPVAGEWRIFDDGSSLGTVIFRDGRRIEVPAHASRGVMLRNGDEIYLGQARLRFDC